jgi:hypothetical protein
MPTRADRVRADLLNASFQYVQGRRAFETAITAARQNRWSDDEIAEATGMQLETVHTVIPPEPGRGTPQQM